MRREVCAILLRQRYLSAGKNIPNKFERKPNIANMIWYLKADWYQYFLQYYCEQCWASIHSRPGREFHKPLVKEGADRLELTPLYHQIFIQRFQQLFTPSLPLVTIVIQWFAGQGPSPSDGAKSFSQLANHHFWFVGHQDCLWGGEKGWNK